MKTGVYRKGRDALGGEMMVKKQLVCIFWPNVPRFYVSCKTDEERLKQRIRRAFEKMDTDMEQWEYFPLAEMLYEKLKHTVKMVTCTGT